jgi:hypothetical protein
MAHLARGRGTIVARTPAVPRRARRKGIADQCGLPLERDRVGNRSAHANAFFDLVAGCLGFFTLSQFGDVPAR